MKAATNASGQEQIAAKCSAGDDERATIYQKSTGCEILLRVVAKTCAFRARHGGGRVEPQIRPRLAPATPSFAEFFSCRRNFGRKSEEKCRRPQSRNMLETSALQSRAGGFLSPPRSIFMMEPANQNDPMTPSQDLALRMVERLPQIGAMADVDGADLVAAMFWKSIESLIEAMGPEGTAHWLRIAIGRLEGSTDGH